MQEIGERRQCTGVPGDVDLGTQARTGVERCEKRHGVRWEAHVNVQRMGQALEVLAVRADVIEHDVD